MNADLNFHSHKGSNVELNESRNCARRQTSFANSIVFSHRPLHPREMFLVRIDAVESGWTGHLRMGLTQLDPNQHPHLPIYALPDLNFLGQSWVVPITRTNSTEFGPMSTQPNTVTALPHKLRCDGDSFSNYASCSGVYESILPADVGSCIGVYYCVSRDDTKAEMHLVVNGQDNLFLNIPYSRVPLFAVADIYGNTKQIRIIPSPNSFSLQGFCRTRILSCLECTDDVHKLPLPIKLKLSIVHANYSPESLNLMQKLL